jgi:hypothetical protein
MRSDSVRTRRPDRREWVELPSAATSAVAQDESMGTYGSPFGAAGANADIKVSWQAFDEIARRVDEVGRRVVGSRSSLDSSSVAARCGSTALGEALVALGRVTRRVVDEAEANAVRDAQEVRNVRDRLRYEETMIAFEAQKMCRPSEPVIEVGGVPIAPLITGPRLEASPVRRPGR